MSAQVVSPHEVSVPQLDDVPGWFDFQEIYARAVREAPHDGAHLVEVGAAYGKSAAYMAWQIRASQKNIRFDAVDLWTHLLGTPDDVEYGSRFGGGSIRRAFMYTLRSRGLDRFVHPIQLDSVAAARAYADDSLDFVFIDADHSYDAVMADITAYFPKLKAGGVIAGHDYHTDGMQVKEAVNQYFKWRTFTVEGNSWWHRKIFKGKSLQGEAL